MMKAELLNAYCATLGEGPCWDEKLQKLWWIDGLSENGRGDDLHLFDPAAGTDEMWHIGKHIGCAVPATDSRVLLNLQDGIYLFDPEKAADCRESAAAAGCAGTPALQEISDLEREIENNRLNDGKCDSRGRFWFGSMSMTANQPEREFEITGSFYRMNPDSSVKKFFGGVGISNGLAWNAADDRFYYVDSTPQTVYQFDFDAEAGEISNRKAIIEIDPAEGCPDGMTIDAEGMLWIAQFGGWKVSRWNPDTGEKLGEIALPCAQVTCPAFGGPDMDQLFITTASIGLSAEERAQQPLAGATFVCRPGVKGLPANLFRVV